MIASVYATAIALVFGRLLTTVFVFSDQLMLIITVIVVFSILAGEAMAYASSKLREILLFSSVAQAAIVVLLFALGLTWLGVTLAILNGFSKLVLFLVVNHVVDQTKTDELSDLKGIFSNNKLVGAAFTVTALSVLGLPLFAGFVVKMNVLKTLFENDNLLIPAVILIASVVEGVYFIKMLIKLWYKKDESKIVSFDIATTVVVASIAVLLIVLGVYFEPLKDIMVNLGTLMIGGVL